MEGGIFITVKDLMKITGSNNYNSCSNLHRTVRDSIAKGKRRMTIKEYCEYEQIEFDYVWKVLREAHTKNHKKT